MTSRMTDVYIDFTVTYPGYFIEEGEIEVKFRVDATNLNVFKFIVDGEIVHSVFSQPDDDWQIYNYDVKKGSHVLQWVYTKFNSKDGGVFLAAEIERIIIKGVQSSGVSQCFACSQGVSEVGAAYCKPCAANSFFNGFGCQTCP